MTSSVTDVQIVTAPPSVGQLQPPDADVSLVTAVAPTPQCSATSMPKQELALGHSSAVATATPAKPASVSTIARNGRTSTSHNTTSLGTAPPVPQVVFRQIMPPKNYNGSSGWKQHRDYFETLSKVNGWTSQIEKAKILPCPRRSSERRDERCRPNFCHPVRLYLDRPAVARRFGYIDSERYAM